MSDLVHNYILLCVWLAQPGKFLNDAGDADGF